MPDRLVLIMRDFLSNRTFRYHIEGALSTPRSVRPVEPQSVALSPYSFILFAGDIPSNINIDSMHLFSKQHSLDFVGNNLSYSYVSINKINNVSKRKLTAIVSV